MKIIKFGNSKIMLNCCRSLIQTTYQIALMKTIKFFATLILMAAAIVVPTTASAQRGEKSLGIAGGFATENNGGFAKVFFQYTFAPHFRIAPEIGYVFRNEGESAFVMSADMHFPFKIAKGFNIYPLAGITFNNWTHHDDNDARVGADFGAGFDVYLTRNLKLNLQGKYSLMNDYSGGFFDFGIAYVF